MHHDFDQRYCSINGKLVDESSASISVKDRGFRFGDGVFETIRIAHAAPFMWSHHLQRLTLGLNALRIDADLEDITTNAKLLLSKNQLNDGFLRIMVSRGVGSVGYLPMESIKPTIVMETMPVATPIASPIKVCISHQLRVSPSMLPVQYKIAQGVSSTLARLEAKEQGCQEAILLNQAGHLTEGSSSNVFFITDKILHTPSLACGVLQGTIRQYLLEQTDITIKQGNYTLDDLKRADAVFMTNIAWEIIAVNEIINLQCYQPSPIIEMLQSRLKKDIQQQCKQGWD